MLKRFTLLTAVCFSLIPIPALADTAADAYAVLGINVDRVLSGTTLTAHVVPGVNKQVVLMTSYITGRKDKHEAVNVRLDILARRGSTLVPIYTRDFGEENGGNVGEGDLQLIDLDTDGLSEVIVSYRSFGDPLIDQRMGEVIVQDDGQFRTAWSGPLEYDATRAARSVPAERRDRFERELDYGKTLGARGLTLFFNKTVSAVAGERLAEPKVVSETFPLRAANDSQP